MEEQKKAVSIPVSVGESDDIDFVLSRWKDPVVPTEGEPYHLYTLKMKRAANGDVLERIDSLKIEDVEALGSTLLLACGYEFGDGEGEPHDDDAEHGDDEQDSEVEGDTDA